MCTRRAQWRQGAPDDAQGSGLPPPPPALPSRPAAVETEAEEDIGNLGTEIIDDFLPEDPEALEFEGDIGGMGLNLRLDREGGIQLRGGEPRREEPLPEPDPRMREDEPGGF